MVTSRRHIRRSGSFGEAARDAEKQLQLFGLVLAQLARKENALLKQPAANQDGIGEERQTMRLETVEVLQAIL